MKRIYMGAVAGWLMLGCGPADHATTSGMAGGGASSAGSGGSNAAGSATGGANAGESGGPNSSGGSGSGGTATGGSTGAGGSGGVPTGAPQGTVQFGRLIAHGAGSGFEASARFYAKDAITETTCSSETFGDCEIGTCTDSGMPATAMPYAGTIMISDGNMLNFTLMGTKGQAYRLPIGSNGSVSGGESVTVTASGDEVPAFMATVAVPKVITITTPTLSAQGVGTAPRNTDLVLTFNNRSADGETGTILYVQSQLPLGSPNITCRLPTASGSATIPSAALQKLSAGASLLLITMRSKQIQAGDFAISVIGYMSATTPDKTMAATIQLE